MLLLLLPVKLGVQFDEQDPVGIVGGARPASGSAAGAIPVTGVGLRVPDPVLL
jgi:hypothetical protein